MTVPLLRVRDLRVELPLQGKWFPAVDGISFDLSQGESLAVVGESGCGKTALARALIGLSPESSRVSGSVLLRGIDLLALAEPAFRRVRGREIALVFQEPASALDPVRTIGDQIVEGVRAHRRLSRSAARRRARELLAEVSFPDPEHAMLSYPHRLSGGLRQRAFLATALAGDPAVLIADEPTTALDATVSAQIMELLERLRRDRKLAMLLVSHDLSAVARHTDRVLVLYAGRVVEEATTSEVFRSPRHPYTRGLLECAPRLRNPPQPGARFPTIAGSVPELEDRSRPRCSFAPRCRERFDPCDSTEPPLYSAGGALVRCFLYGSGPEDGAVQIAPVRAAPGDRA